MPWLLWRLTKEAKSAGLRELDLGRSDWTNPGLIVFKDRLGAKRIPVTYWRFPKPRGVADALSDGRLKWLPARIFRLMPAPVLTATFIGPLVERHRDQVLNGACLVFDACTLLRAYP
jgi:hypothetical protein